MDGLGHLGSIFKLFYMIVKSPGVHLETLYTQDPFKAIMICSSIIFIETAFIFFPFLPGDMLLIVVGCILKKFGLPFLPTYLSLVFSAALGGLVNYWIGFYLGGRKLIDRLESFPNFQSKVLKGRKILDQYGRAAVVFARFVGWVRSFVPYLAGAGMMPLGTYFKYNLLGAILWISAMLQLGDWLHHYTDYLGYFLTLSFLSTPLVFSVILILRFFRRCLISSVEETPASC